MLEEGDCRVRVQAAQLRRGFGLGGHSADNEDLGKIRWNNPAAFDKILPTPSPCYGAKGSRSFWVEEN